ncbi:MAG: hypothetical protein JW829_19520 [Pirellulales bacterium]|nr:hypothetical protein [Pirellulales bacterium]
MFTGFPTVEGVIGAERHRPGGSGNVSLREEPPGVFRVGQGCVLLDLVLRAFQRG